AVPQSPHSFPTRRSSDLDTEKLGGIVELKKEFLQQLAASSDAVEPGLAASLERAIEDFHAQALVVSKQLIAGETGESVVAKMSRSEEHTSELQSQSNLVC